MQVNFFYINIHRITPKDRYLWDLGSSVPFHHQDDNND